MKKRYRLRCLASVLITFSLACCRENQPESETESKIEPGLKLVVIDYTQQVTEVESDETRRWQLPVEVDQRVVSVSAGPQGQLLLVEVDGVIGVVSGEETKEYTQIGEGVVAAWSNDGQQIAIMHQPFQRNGQPWQSTLEIVDADFQTLWTETIDLLSGGDEGFYPSLSWSADDRLLALSALNSDQNSYLIVDVHARAVFLKEGYSSVFFIGSRMLAGRHYQDESSEIRASEIQVAQVELHADGVEIVSPTTIVALPGHQLCGLAPSNEHLVSGSSNPARLVIWRGDILLDFPYAFEGPCRILDEQGHVLAEMPEIFTHIDSFCLTRSSEAD